MTVCLKQRAAPSHGLPVVLLGVLAVSLGRIEAEGLSDWESRALLVQRSPTTRQKASGVFLFQKRLPTPFSSDSF